MLMNKTWPISNLTSEELSAGMSSYFGAGEATSSWNRGSVRSWSKWDPGEESCVKSDPGHAEYGVSSKCFGSVSRDCHRRSAPGSPLIAS